jgi:hypothetical protein
MESELDKAAASIAEAITWSVIPKPAAIDNIEELDVSTPWSAWTRHQSN